MSLVPIIYNTVSLATMAVVVFHYRLFSHLFYNFQVALLHQDRVKLKMILFPAPVLLAVGLLEG